MSAGTGMLIAGGIAAAGSVASGIIQANAAGAAGKAQADSAQTQEQLAQQALSQQISARQQGISQAQTAAAMTPGEIQSIQSLLQTRDQALNSSLASLQKQQAQVDAMSPETKAAGQNLYNLLTGQSAAILQPLQTQLNLQRQNLVNQLSSQMGPGFMTSSAGIQALTTFDNQASMTLNTAQQNAIQTVGAQYGQLQGLSQQGQQSITSGIQSAFQQAQTATGMAQQGYQVGANRETQATLGAMSANPINFYGPAEAQAAVTGTAGLPYSRQITLGQGIGQAGQGLSQGLGFGAILAGQKSGGTTSGGGYAPISMPNVSFGSSLANGAQTNPANIVGTTGYNPAASGQVGTP